MMLNRRFDMKWYKLVDKEIVECDMIEAFNYDRTLAFDTYKGVNVSTVFLGINHGIVFNDLILFETMVFGGEFDGEQERYRSYEEAMLGHKRISNKVLK